MKRYQVFIIIVNTALAVVILVLAGALVFRYSPSQAEAEQGYVHEELKVLEARMDELSSQNRELASRLSEIADKLSEHRTFAPGGEIRERLPREYVDQIDAFFSKTTPKAQELLSEKARARGAWKFGKPRFITPDLIALDYSHQAETETLLLSIKVLDYADLEFKVIWDSLEVQP